MPRLQDKRILVIDDDSGVLQLVKLVFVRENAQVYTANSGSEGLRKFYQNRPHLVILDLMMPEMDGWEVCRHIRQLSDVPLIMLTALTQEDKMVQGLACGADDYITKPFKPEVLLARVHAVLRRTETTSTSEETVFIYHDQHLLIDVNKRRVQVEGQSIKLSAKEYAVLIYLLRHADRVLTFEQILAHVWGDEYKGHAQYVHAYMWRLRQKLEEHPDNPSYLVTEHGVGYRFETQHADN